MQLRQFFLIFKSRVVQNKWRLLSLFCGILAPLVLFGMLAEIVRTQGGLAFDVPVLHFIHRYASPQWDAWIVWGTVFGRVAAIPVLLVVAAGLRWLFKHPWGAAFFVIAAAGGLGLNLLTKQLFQRTRPALWVSGAPESTYSFPSGHAMLSMTIATTLVLIAWPTRLRWPAFVSAIPCVLAISGSRLYLGVHFPSDILAGWAAGAAWVTGVYFILRHSRHDEKV